MAEKTSGDWDEDQGYRFTPGDKKKESGGRISLPSRSKKHNKGNAVVRNDLEFDRMHPDFPDTHDYLRESLDDLNFMSDRIRAMKKDQQAKKQRSDPDDTERVTIRRRTEHPRSRNISQDDLEESKEYKKRRIRKKAIKRVMNNLREKGYDDEFLRNNMDMIKQKVDDFLNDQSSRK